MMRRVASFLKGTAKEWGVFALLNTCVSAGGKRLLKTWFQRPLLNMEVINERLDAVEHFKSREELGRTLEGMLPGGHDIHSVIGAMARNMNKATRTLDDWARLEKFLRKADAMARTVHEHYVAGGALIPGTPLALGRLLRIREGLGRLRALISAVIDLDQGGSGSGGKVGLVPHSAITGHCYEGLVKPGVCRELDDMWRLYHGLPDLLTRVRRLEVSRIPRVLQGRGVEDRMSVVYLPKVGYALKLEGSTLPPDIAEELPDVEFAFDQVAPDQEYSSYYFTQTTRELTGELGDILPRIVDLESAILCDLRNRVLSNAPLLRDAALCISEIDCLLSLARCATAYRMSRPRLVRENVLEIVNGWHLLQQVACDQAVIPNGTHVPAVKGRVTVVTGRGFFYLAVSPTWHSPASDRAFVSQSTPVLPPCERSPSVLRGTNEHSLCAVD